MLNFDRLSKRPQVFKSLCGITINEFNDLLFNFKSALNILEPTFYKHNRIRKLGGGRNEKLILTEDKLLFILMYFKTYLLQEVQAILFDQSQSNTNVWIHRLTVVLNKALGYEKQLPKRNASDLEELLNKVPELRQILIDGTETRIADLRIGKYKRTTTQEKRKLIQKRI